MWIIGRLFAQQTQQTARKRDGGTFREKKTFSIRLVLWLSITIKTNVYWFFINKNFVNLIVYAKRYIVYVPYGFVSNPL